MIRTQWFPTVLVDEACQVKEAETLIPLRYNMHRLVLVGDQKQLEATVKSKDALEAYH